MSTLLNKTFLVCDLTGGSFGDEGEFTDGTASVRSVRGSIQALNSRDAALIESGSRNVGKCKVYSSSRLNSRDRNNNGNRSFVLHNDTVFEVIDHVHFDNKLISHEKYICDMVPTDQIPVAVTEAFGL